MRKKEAPAPAPAPSGQEKPAEQSKEEIAAEVNATLEQHEPSKPKAHDTRGNEIYDELVAELSQQGLPSDQASIDALMEMDLDGDAFTAESPHKGIKYEEMIESLPDNAQKYIANLRADYTRKTQEISRQRQELEAQAASLVGSEWDKALQAEVAKEKAEFDPFDEKTYESRIEAEVAKRMNEMMEPIRKQYAQQQREVAFEQFKAAHSDFDDLKLDVAKLLIKDKNLNSEQAYHIVRSRKLEAESTSKDEELRQLRRAAREQGLRISTGRGRARAKPPKGLSAWETYQWFSEHSEES